MFKKIVKVGGGDIRHLVRYLIGKRIISYNNLRWEIKPADNHTDYIMWLNGSSGEDKELSLLSELIEGKDITFVDIGANIGLFSVFLSSIAGVGSKIYSFEPNPKMRERLKKNIELNSINNIEVFPYAVGAEQCELRLNFPSRWNSGEASLILQPRNESKSISVPVYPLFDVLPDNQKVDLIKIDIEGAEDRALIPYLEKLPKELYPTYIFMEHTHADCWERDLGEYLIDVGYVEKSQTGANSLYWYR